MKTLNLIITFLMISTVTLMAQKEANKFQEITIEKVPGKVLAALENDFSGDKVVAYFILPVDIYEDAWSHKQTKEETAAGEDKNHYLVEFDADVKYNKVVYDAQGVLLQRREIIKGAELPTTITDFINSEYKDYVITKDKEMVLTSDDGTVDHYKITIKFDKKVKHLYFNGKGELLKEN